MAKAPKAETEDAAAAPAPAAKSRKTLIIVAAAVLLAAAGAGWMFLGGSSGGDAQARPEAGRKSLGTPVFLPLDPFIVNLQPQTSGQFLQVDVTLRVADSQVVNDLKTLMPEVRDRVLRLLSTKTAQELAAPGGREKLAEAVRIEVTSVIDPDAVPRPAAAPITKLPGEPDLPPEPSADAFPDTTAPASPEQPASEAKVRAVLFTSFIIQ